MPSFDYDLFVIGAGSGGVRASRIAAGHGACVGICEESRVGGTCVIRGCVPKKLLVFASQFSEHFADAAGYGWDVGESSFSWPDLIAAKDREIDRLNGVYHMLLDNAGVDLFEKRGRLLDRHTVDVGGQRVTADKILIATGGRPWVPDIPGAELGITSDEAFHLESLPKRILVAGAGYIAAEFAGIFNGMGSEVTLAYRRDLILRGFDDDVRKTVESGMRGRGIDIQYHCAPARLERSGDGIAVTFSDDRVATFDCVMFATGRSPYTWDLGLEDAGVRTGAENRIEVDEYNRTSVDNVFAVGDVTDRLNLTPVALMEGHAFADTQFGGMDRPVEHSNVPAAVFSQPPVGTVGLTESEARERFDDVHIYRSSFTPMKYTLSGRKEKGVMKLVVDAVSDRVLGCHMVGPDAPEIVQGFAVAVRAGLTKADFDRTVGIHPTSAEELVTLRQRVVD
ncbi:MULTISPECIES: glutathione-disulfide reductase [unclassified Wenzhouxiangella]|uniref:glutathione-disulfide reductase n=1 Tax=unclassified Wenzhouxiangella TaxID=2613841 RepID=UPI000E32B389|nr:MULTISPECIES: glutathione-disulfide reductase [unclassified Wenzhouxiangella]RFF27533.1 glutathione-disulfide reductase [Wenzhouxiangella sp. 15181]RFP69605.1 glutathione-disulfide reductase [Wenzhouxiangella sp. 15190]